jgi:hypothetical protein
MGCLQTVSFAAAAYWVPVSPAAAVPQEVQQHLQGRLTAVVLPLSNAAVCSWPRLMYAHISNVIGGIAFAAVGWRIFVHSHCWLPQPHRLVLGA